VHNELEDQFIHTKNSIYRAEGPGKRVTASEEAFYALRAVNSPREFEVIATLKKQLSGYRGPKE